MSIFLSSSTLKFFTMVSDLLQTKFRGFFRPISIKITHEACGYIPDWIGFPTSDRRSALVTFITIQSIEIHE